ncbi:MAG: LysM peptidoglycan-binding protein [Burkholderiaceae bacterium]|nr:LysM peptidoglycan-binding protein [Burkholderiaceae bacterium]
MRKTFFPTAVRAVSSVLVLSALAFSGAHAAGLGKLTVLSSLGQPLRAEIELTSVSKDDVGSIGAKLAPMDAFRKANISYNSALSSLRFSVETRGERQVIRITSSQPMNEPFVDMLLELKSSSGHLVREYTFLLDPAELRTASAQVVTPAGVPALGADAAPSRAKAEVPAVKKAAPAVEEKPAPVAKAKPAKPAKPAEETKEAKEEKGAAQHRVKKGETLAGIAKQNIHEDVSLEQMLVAIYRANPEAFAGNNMNRLKVGKVLSIPDAEDAGSVGKSEARKVIVAQSSDFTSYRNRLAGAAAQAAPQKAAEAGQVGGGQIGAKVEERPTATTDAKDKLKVARADAAKGDKAAGVASAEDKLAKDKAAAEAQARIKELEKNISDLQGVLQMKNKDMAAQQKQAEKPAASAPAASAAQASVPAASAPAASAAAASVPAASASAAASVAAKPSAPKKKAAPPPPPEEPGFFDELLDNPMMLGGLGVVILLLAYVFIRRRKKPKAEPLPPQTAAELPEESKEPSNSLFGAPGGQSVDTNNSIFNSSFTPSASLLDTNEVDPIAEADVYIAYGREAQAIEILKEALRNHPERNALRIKLLEVYAAKKDLHAFDLLASELYSLTKGEGEEWVYAAGLGVSIDPGNPLYAGGDLSEELLARPTSLQGSVTRPSEELDPDILLATSRKQDLQEQHAEPAGLQIPPEQLQHPDLPLDLEPADTAGIEVPPVAPVAAYEPPAAPAEQSPEPAALNFDLGLSDDFGKVEALKPVEAAATETAKEEADAGLDFVLSEPVAKPAALAPEAQSEPEKKPASDALDFDLGALDFAQPKPANEEVASAAGLEVKEFAAEDDLDQLIEFKLQQPVALAEDSLDIEMAQEDVHMPVEESQKMSETLGAQSASQTHEPAVPAFDFGAINLDLEPVQTASASTDEPAAAAGNVEMETKLDLADAYLGIGDKEGARELLEEVIQEGSGEQVERAKATLAKIS